MHTTATPVSISVDLSAFKAHLFNITIELDSAQPQQRLSMPVWTPGSYMVREFAQHIVSIAASDKNGAVAVRKVDKNTFEIENALSSVSINYSVYGFDPSIRAAFIDDRQAFFNGCALFLRPHGFENTAYQLKLARPHDRLCAAWHVATGMPKHDVDEKGFGTYRAANYDELVDYPFQVSEMEHIRFEANGVPHEMVLVGDVRPFDRARLARDVSALCAAHIVFFGGVAPFSSYIFLARFEEGGYGGLEHRNSSMLLHTPLGLPHGSGEPDAHYRSFLGLCSHEYYHAWNIKRLKPRNFIPFDFDREVYTTLLWLFEGITSYYDDLALRRANLISAESYLELMGKNYSKLLRNRGRLTQPLADASHDAWIKFYRPNENSNNATTSYYLKGSFIGLYLDLLIREKNHDDVSLDTVMMTAYERYGTSGITEDDFFTLLAEVGRIDVADFKKRFIYGTEDLPLASLLENVGISLALLPDELIVDDKTKMRAYVGARLRFDEHGRAIVAQVDYESPAMLAGLCPLDEVIGLNGIRFEQGNSADLLGTINVHDDVAVVFSRRKIMQTTTMKAVSLPKTRSILNLSQPTVRERDERRLQWLGA